MIPERRAVSAIVADIGLYRQALPHRLAHLRHHGLAGALALQKAAVARIEPLLRLDLPHQRRGAKYDFLTEALRRETEIIDTDAVSSNAYDGFATAMIAEQADGTILDCGAGRRSVYYDNVVNFEIVDYDTTDVIGVGEQLPFHDGVFDGVISVAVLEHVRDPFRCASEISRVLKPGGRLICAVPFLQPEHGYPNHYYNMAPQGLRNLFKDALVIDDHKVLESTSPPWVLNWIVQSWADGLRGRAREQFLQLRLQDLLTSPLEMNKARWVSELSPAKMFELASATVLFAHKQA